MLPDIASAVGLQEVDNRLTDLTKEIASLPKHIDEIEKRLESQQWNLEADRAALGANQKDRKKLEGDIQVQEQKITKLKDQMLQAKTNDQYQAFQHEIGFCQAEIRRAEDRILDLMAESEGLEKNLKAAEVSLKAEKAQVEAEKQQARERTEVDQNAVNELEKAKKAIVSSMTPSVYKNYKRIRSRRGVAVAEVLEGRCSVCPITRRPQDLQDLKPRQPGQARETCHRILYYNPPANFEDLAGPSATAAHLG